MNIEHQSQELSPSMPEAEPMLIDWGMRQDSVRAMLLTSTRAIPCAEVDILSDYDVILVLEDIQPFIKDYTWLNDFGKVLVAYWDPVHTDPEYGIEHCANVVQYRQGHKIDFTLWPEVLLQAIVSAAKLPAELDAGYRVLLDKDHLTDQMQPPTGKAYVPKPPTSEAYQLHINDFLSDAPYVAKCLWRDELLPAKWCLDYDMKQVYLRQMLEWLVEIDQGWSLPVGFLGKGLKKHLPPEIWNALEQTFTGAQIDENWVALERTLALFRRAAIRVGEVLGYPYPETLHESVCAYVDAIRQMKVGTN